MDLTVLGGGSGIYQGLCCDWDLQRVVFRIISDLLGLRDDLGLCTVVAWIRIKKVDALRASIFSPSFLFPFPPQPPLN